MNFFFSFVGISMTQAIGAASTLHEWIWCQLGGAGGVRFKIETLIIAFLNPKNKREGKIAPH